MQRYYIDVNAGIGRMNVREQEIPYATESLLSEMDYCRIHAALVYSLKARDFSFVAGNRQLQDAVKAGGRLYGAAVVPPSVKYELEEGEAYLDALVHGGARAFRMFPSALSHSFSPFLLEDIAAYMAERRLPLLVDLYQVDRNALSEVLRAFPGLDVLLCACHWSENRDVFPLMEKHANLHFELSDNQGNDILAVCKRHFGVDRVLFGTGYPMKSPGALKSLVEYSDLSESDKDKVAWANAARLFRIDPADLHVYGQDACATDSFARAMDGGRPLAGELVIDAHAHMMGDEDRAPSSAPMPGADAASMVCKMDRLGVSCAIVSPWEGLMTAEGGNRTVFQAMERFPGRVLAYATWNPHYPDDLGEVIGTWHEKHRFVGLKPYVPRHMVGLLDPRYARWFEYGNRHRLILLVHVDNAGVPEQAAELSRRYPELSILLAHSAQNYGVARSCAAAAKACANLYLEITYTSLTYGAIEFLVQEAGADKVLYGSDWPMRDCLPQLAWVCYARIPEEDKRKILGLNIRGLIERCYS